MPDSFNFSNNTSFIELPLHITKQMPSAEEENYSLQWSVDFIKATKRFI